MPFPPRIRLLNDLAQ